MPIVTANHQQLQHAKRTLRTQLQALDGIGSFAIAWTEKGVPCVRVDVDAPASADLIASIPSEIEGVPVIIREVITDIRLESSRVAG
jgi:hypothetical protein